MESEFDSIDDELSRMTPREFAASMRAARARCDAAPKRAVPRTNKEVLELLQREKTLLGSILQERDARYAFWNQKGERTENEKD